MKQQSREQSLISWERIQDFFGGEWVELVDYEWKWERPNPSVARVRNHARDRNTLLSKIKSTDKALESVILYVSPTSAFPQTVVQFEIGVAA